MLPICVISQTITTTANVYYLGYVLIVVFYSISLIDVYGNNIWIERVSNRDYCGAKRLTSSPSYVDVNEYEEILYLF